MVKVWNWPCWYLASGKSVELVCVGTYTWLVIKVKLTVTIQLLHASLKCDVATKWTVSVHFNVCVWVKREYGGSTLTGHLCIATCICLLSYFACCKLFCSDNSSLLIR